MMYWNDFENRVRMVCCSASGNVPTMRSTVFEASIVCSVDITRWPVSDASIAVSIVSRSRISPTRMTFGACRSAARSAMLNVGVSLCSSRWWIVAFLCPCRNSIGSSIVTMWIARCWFIRSTIAASVEDLPDPVGPVTRTMPLRSGTIDASTSGSRRSANVGTFIGMTRMITAYDDRWRKMLTRKRARLGSAYDRSADPSRFICSIAIGLPLIRSSAISTTCWVVSFSSPWNGVSMSSPLAST